MNALKAVAKMKADGSIDASVSMFRLFMQDFQMKDKDTPLLAKEFQYLICNPKTELAGDELSDNNLGQLKVSFVANGKENEQNISTTLADFRINIAFHTVKALLIFSQKLQGFGDNVLKKLEELQKVNAIEGIKKEKPKPIKIEEQPKKGKLTVDVKLANVETIIPIDATKANTAIIKFSMSTDVKFTNTNSTEGVTSRVVDTNITSLSIICSEEERVESILNEMSIVVKYGEEVGAYRDIFVNIKPIMIKATFKELQLFQLCADSITHDLEELQPKEEEEVEGKIEQKVEENKELEPKLEEKTEKGPKLKVVAKMKLLKFILEDNLSKYKYPLVKMWIANMAVDVVLDPMNGTKVAAHIFEIAIELGQMFNKDIENTKCYETYFKQLPFSNIEDEQSEAIELYRESMYFEYSTIGD